MYILIVDVQGGGVGRQLVQSLRTAFSDDFIMAVGTNSAATSAMLTAGANAGAGTDGNADNTGSTDPNNFSDFTTK